MKINWYLNSYKFSGCLSEPNFNSNRGDREKKGKERTEIHSFIYRLCIITQCINISNFNALLRYSFICIPVYMKQTDDTILPLNAKFYANENFTVGSLPPIPLSCVLAELP